MRGDLCSDKVIESNGGRKENDTIKSHHNVLYSEELRELVEPFPTLFKDPVKRLGSQLHLSPSLLSKQPFPSPDLVIRVIGDVTKKVKLLGQNQKFIEREFQKENLEKHSDQYLPQSCPQIKLRKSKGSKDFMSVSVNHVTIGDLIVLGNKIVTAFLPASREYCMT